MHETREDITVLQDLLDRSYAGAGQHLRSITTPGRRMTAKDVVQLLDGIQIFDLATVTTQGKPRIGAVDGLFFRGRLYFGSSRRSHRYRHLLSRPHVSAAQTRGESLSVVIHGAARLFSLDDAEHSGFRDCCYEVYVPRYGDGWKQFAHDPDIFYGLIEPELMFTFRMDSPRLP